MLRYTIIKVTEMMKPVVMTLARMYPASVIGSGLGVSLRQRILKRSVRLS